VFCWSAFPLVSALGSTNSAADHSALFVGFPATMAESDFSRPCIIGYGSSPFGHSISRRSLDKVPSSSDTIQQPFRPMIVRSMIWSLSIKA
jgi:hypothetical protein